MAKKQRLLLIGPPPYQGSGSRVRFEFLLEYLSGFSNLVVTSFDLPVFSPLHNANGTVGPLNHIRTCRRLLRAVMQVPRVDLVVVYGTSDFCFSYGLVLALTSKLFRGRCVAMPTGGRGIFGTRRLPKPARTICLAMIQTFGTFVVQTKVARNDLPCRLWARTIVVNNFRPRLPGLLSTRRDGEGKKVGFAFLSGFDGAAGEKKPTKGLDVLLDAFDHLCAVSGASKHIELHLYGPLPPSLTERATRTSNIVAHGLLSGEQLRVSLGQHDVLAFPSRYAFEGHPGAIIEAFMVGLPVIASALPGPMEIVAHEVNGLVVKTGDSEAFAAAMNRLACDQEFRHRLSAGARASASNFDQEKILPELAAALGLLPAATMPGTPSSSAGRPVRTL